MIRRDVLKLGGAATVGMMITSPAALARPVAARPAIVLVDDRFADAQGFADAARRDGTGVFHTNGDVLSLLNDRLRKAPLAGMAGLTSYAEMLIMAGLAADARRPLALRIAHEAGTAGTAHRVIDGPLASQHVLEAAGPYWGEGLWTVLAGQSATWERRGRRARAAGQVASLWSWSIA